MYVVSFHAMLETSNRSTQQPQGSSKQHCQVHNGVSMIRIVKLHEQRKVSAGDAASMPPRDAAGLAEWTQLNGPAEWTVSCTAGRHLQCRGGASVVQEPLGRRQHQRLGERPVHLPPQHVEQLQDEKARRGQW